MGNRSTSKHAASAQRVAAARMRRLLVAVVCGGSVFALSGFVLGSATVSTRLYQALGVALVAYAGLAFARARRAQAGRRRAVAAVPVAEQPVSEPEDIEPSVAADGRDVVEPSPAEVVGDAEVPEDAEAVPGVDLEENEVTFVIEDTDLSEEADAEVIEEVAISQENHSEEDGAEPTPALAHVEAADAGVPVTDATTTHDLVPLSSLYEARAHAEQESLRRIQATVRGLGVRTGDDPVAVDVLARVVAAVDRLMAPDSFARPALSDTGSLLAAAAAEPLPAAPPARPATPLPAVPAMRPSDMPVTELSATQPPPAPVPDERPGPAPIPQTQPIEAVVVDDPDLVLPIPAPPKPQPAPRGRRLRRSSVA
jgi:hypothetical protein